jgi:hypothetical protein
MQLDWLSLSTNHSIYNINISGNGELHTINMAITVDTIILGFLSHNLFETGFVFVNRGYYSLQPLERLVN